MDKPKAYIRSDSITFWGQDLAAFKSGNPFNFTECRCNTNNIEMVNPGTKHKVPNTHQDLYSLIWNKANVSLELAKILRRNRFLLENIYIEVKENE